MLRLILNAATTVVVVAAMSVCTSLAWAAPFQVGIDTGNNTNHLYAQGFFPGLRADPDPFTDPMLAPETIVHLNRFRFFKSNYFFESPPGSGTFVPLVATNLQLAIVDNYFLELNTFTTDSVNLIGLSTNTIATTATIATGDPIDFEFDDLELSYGEVDYAAIFVRNDGAGNLDVVDTPVLIVDYAEDPPGSGTFLPTVDYGDPSADFAYSCSNFIDQFPELGTAYLRTFNPPFADARFIAYFDQEAPEGLPGDYNGDDIVDAADYTVWRNNLGTNFNLSGNGDESGASAGTVDEADYTWWKQHYGDFVPPPGGGGVASTVPEPGSLAMLTALAGWVFCRGATGRRRS